MVTYVPRLPSDIPLAVYGAQAPKPANYLRVLVKYIGDIVEGVHESALPYLPASRRLLAIVPKFIDNQSRSQSSSFESSRQVSCLPERVCVLADRYALLENFSEMRKQEV